jgi:O-succinylhomoserine sulfhydrylase
MSDDTTGIEKKSSASWRPATQMVRGGTMRSEFSETCEALFMTSGYVYPSAEEAERAFKKEVVRFMYSRYANPTVAMFEKRLAILEGAEHCHATASGMAAVFASLACHLSAGDRIVASRALFGSCSYIICELLPRYGIEFELVDGTNIDQWEAAIKRKKTHVVFLETPSNPGLEIIDLPAVCDLAHKANAKVIVDNVFATPVLQKPLQLGADVVVYSTTKHIDGQGRCLGGAVLTNDQDYFEEELCIFLRNTGPSISPFNAWLLLKGMETLDLRVRQHCANAQIIAEMLVEQESVRRVLYPGLDSHPQYELAAKQMDASGTVLAFEVKGGRDGAFRFMNALKMIDIANNLGDTKSLVTHPATTTHQRLSPEERAHVGISDDLVRLSVGLEDTEDMKEDLIQALAAI